MSDNNQTPSRAFIDGELVYGYYDGSSFVWFVGGIKEQSKRFVITLKNEDVECATKCYCGSGFWFFHPFRFCPVCKNDGNPVCSKPQKLFL